MTEFHDRRDEGRRHSPMYFGHGDALTAKEQDQLYAERLAESGRDPEQQHADWADKMMRAQDAEEGGLEQQRGMPRY